MSIGHCELGRFALNLCARSKAQSRFSSFLAYCYDRGRQSKALHCTEGAKVPEGSSGFAESETADVGNQ